MNEVNIGDAVYAIKNKKKQVVSFVQKYGGAVKRGDSNIKLGKELTRLMSTPTPAMEKEFSAIVGRSKSNSLFGIDDLVAGATNLITAKKQQQTAAQTGQDAITLALINAGASKGTGNTSLYIALGILALVIVGVVVLIIVKSKK